MTALPSSPSAAACTASMPPSTENLAQPLVSRVALSTASIGSPFWPLTKITFPRLHIVLFLLSTAVPVRAPPEALRSGRSRLVLSRRRFALGLRRFGFLFSGVRRLHSLRWSDPPVDVGPRHGLDRPKALRSRSDGVVAGRRHVCRRVGRVRGKPRRNGEQQQRQRSKQRSSMHGRFALTILKLA